MTLRTDAYHHLWDLARPRPFLDGVGMSAIRRSHGLPELRTVAARCGVDATALVQTLAEESETVEFLGLATDSAGLIAAVVGWIDLTAPDVSQRLSSLRAVRGGGPDRVMAGSDWPICERAAPVEAVWRMHETFLQTLTALDLAAVWRLW
ncbi:hypothetical protein [Saccharopolyspora shandongensis]|uniref:hypothetical protein n=1 Tax=Saccharopolyspora shandongensis TaxID=418495 RepID=UPI0033E33B89